MLIGNLTRDPELRYTPSGVAVCNFGLATNRRWNDAEGNLQESTEFHRLVAWGKLAELCSQLLFKGRKVYVEGRLQTREWTGQDGNKRTTTEIVVDNMLVLDSKRKEEELTEPAISAEEKQPAEEVAEPVAATEEKPEEESSQTSAQPAVQAEEKPKVEEEKKKPEEEKEEEPEVKKEDIPF